MLTTDVCYIVHVDNVCVDAIDVADPPPAATAAPLSGGDRPALLVATPDRAVRCRRCHAPLGHGHVAPPPSRDHGSAAAPAPPLPQQEARDRPAPKSDALSLAAVAAALADDAVPAPTALLESASEALAGTDAAPAALLSVRLDRFAVREVQRPAQRAGLEPLTADDWLRRWRENGRGRFMVFGRRPPSATTMAVDGQRPPQFTFVLAVRRRHGWVDQKRPCARLTAQTLPEDRRGRHGAGVDPGRR